MKKAKKILVLSLTAVFLSDITVPYSDLGAVNASDYPASGNCVFRANEVSVNVSDLRIDGAVCETSDIPEMNSGIMSCLDDETEIASQKMSAVMFVRSRTVYTAVPITVQELQTLSLIRYSLRRTVSD